MLCNREDQAGCSHYHNKPKLKGIEVETTANKQQNEQRGLFFSNDKKNIFMLKMAKLSDFYIKSHILNDKFQKLISKIVLNFWVSFGLRQGDFTKVEKVSYIHQWSFRLLGFDQKSYNLFF